MALTLSQDWEEIAQQLVEKYDIAHGHVELDKVLILSEDEKTPKKYADVRLVPYPYDFITEYKYIIIFYENNCQAMTDAQKIMLVHHELLHIDETFTKLRKHNIEDFREIVGHEAIGVNWDIDPDLPNILEEDLKGFS